MLQDISPNTKTELKMKPQEKDKFCGNYFICRHIGQGADLQYFQFKAFFTARTTHFTVNKEVLS